MRQVCVGLASGLCRDGGAGIGLPKIGDHRPDLGVCAAGIARNSQPALGSQRQSSVPDCAHAQQGAPRAEPLLRVGGTAHRGRPRRQKAGYSAGRVEWVLAQRQR